MKRISWLAVMAAVLPLCGQAPVEDPPSQELGQVRRIYVDLLTGGESALKIRDLLIASLQSTKLFVVTEDPAKADAVLKGTGEDTAFTETFQSSDNLTAHSQVSVGSRSTERNTRGTGVGLSLGENEARRTEERKHEAIATVRLVGKYGDVLWSTTQESFGGKFLGAAADVADKVAKKLATDMREARHPGPHT